MRFIIFFIFAVIISCNNSPFKISQTEQGVEISEGGQKVLFYQAAPKAKNGEFSRANYVHPLYNLEGDTLTQDFPEDDPIKHYHQRGIYLAWHQVYVNGKRMGNGWKCEYFNWEVKDIKVKSQEDNRIVLTSNVFWTSSQWKTADGQLKPFVKEKL